MNEQLAQTLGIKFIRKGSHNLGNTACDLRISKSTQNRYALSFSKKTANKLGDYIRIAVAKNRIWIAPGCADAYGYKLAKNTATRRYVMISAASIGFIDKFIGEHELKYSEELDVYYITESKEVTA